MPLEGKSMDQGSSLTNLLSSMIPSKTANSGSTLEDRPKSIKVLHNWPGLPKSLKQNSKDRNSHTQRTCRETTIYMWPWTSPRPEKVQDVVELAGAMGDQTLVYRGGRWGYPAEPPGGQRRHKTVRAERLRREEGRGRGRLRERRRKRGMRRQGDGMRRHGDVHRKQNTNRRIGPKSMQF